MRLGDSGYHRIVTTFATIRGWPSVLAYRARRLDTTGRSALFTAALLAILAEIVLLDGGLPLNAIMLGSVAVALVLVAVARAITLARAREGDRVRADAFAAVGAALVSANSRIEVYDAALAGAKALAGPGYEIVLYVGEDDAYRLVASSEECPRTSFELAEFEAGPRTEIEAGRAIDTWLGLLIPLVTRESLIGLLGIEGPPVRPAARRMLITLAYQVALGLDSAVLIESLVRSESEARLGSLVRNSSELVLIVAHDTTISYASPAVERVLGRTQEEVTGLRLSDLMLRGSAISVARAMVAATRRADDPPPLTSFQLTHGDGTAVHAEALITDMTGDPNVRGYVINIRDVTERMQFEDRLSHQAFHDLTTGLANRALFCSRIVHALERRYRADVPVAVLFLDLDDFRIVNDSLGHSTGDELLAAVGRRLVESTRAADTVARVGGDQFAILLEASPDGDAVASAGRVHDLLEQPFSFGGREVFAHASIGIAFADPLLAGDEGAEQLLRNADLAMYLAKEEGKARCRIFEPAMHQAVYDRLELKSDLELAIERGELSLHYQPVVRLATGAPSGFEALLRWQHPTRGNVPPLDFIPLAEETGLIVQIGRRVLQAACRDGVRLNAASGASDAIRVGVNLSARQLQRPELIDEVRGALASSGLPSELLVLELTETVMMRDIDLSTRRLAELKELGVMLALDDFGTGYSSLNYIQRFPIDILKIDKSFTDALGPGRDGRLTEAIAGLASALGLVLVAEGIEQPGQADRLRALGCELGQGYLFSPAVPIGEALLQCAAETLRTAAAV